MLGFQGGMQDEMSRKVLANPDMNDKLRETEMSSTVRSLYKAAGKNKGYFLLVFDFLLINAAFIFSYQVRFHLSEYVSFLVQLSEMEQYAKAGLLLGIIWVFLIWRDGGYDVGIFGLNLTSLRLRSLLSCGFYALCILMVISFLYRGMLLSRTVYIMSGFLAGIALVAIRVGINRFERSFSGKGIVTQKVAVVGSTEETKRFISKFSESWTTGEIVGVLLLNDDKSTSDYEGFRVIGSLDSLADAYDKWTFDTLVIPTQDQTDMMAKAYSEKIIKVINFCEEHGISLYMLPGSYDVAVSRHEVGNFSGIPLIKLQDTSLHPAYAVVKRILDLFAASLALVVGFPVWLLIAVFIKWESKGPIFFIQIRAGFHGRPFRMYKFRSMVMDAEEKLKDLVDIDNLDEPVFKIKNDPRVTAVGKFLRRTSLDEIPQLLNVIKGEMSIVGPRPEELSIVDKYSDYQRRRLKAKPGITGYQQITNRGEPRLAERIKYDLIYLKYQGFLLDSYILLKTIYVVLVGRGVTH